MSEQTNNKQEKKIVMVRYPEIGATYQHYKGGKYRVITCGKHTENGEIQVVCQSIEFHSIHIRPLSMWFEVIAEKSSLLKKVERFELLVNG